jgi:uncharacterized protein YbaR (Trm112 family)
MIDTELLAILACPKCKGELEYRPSEDGKNGSLVCQACQLEYKIVDDIPNLIIEDALPLNGGVQQ